MSEVTIYYLEDPITNEVRYVGKTTNVLRRYNTHLNRSKTSKTHSACWINSLLLKNEKPLLRIIEVVQDNWAEREKYWIAYYRQKFDLTNITEGGEGGITYGRLGKKNSDEHKKKCSDARKGVSIKQKDTDGKRRRAIIDFCNKNKNIVLQYDLEGNFIREWDCAVSAATELGGNHSNITKRAKQRKGKVYGFMWRYKDDHIENKIDSYKADEPWNKGKICSEEIKEKISSNKKGKPWSDARRLSQNLKNAIT